jgi:hypothetical protein
MSPTHLAIRVTTPTFSVFPLELMYTFVFETRSRKTSRAIGVLNESQSAARKSACAFSKLSGMGQSPIGWLGDRKG